MPVIFLLEDDPIVKSALELHLKSEGFDVLSHPNLASARTTIGYTQEFDLYLLDVNLPDGNGFEFCQWLRERVPSAPVIFLTARADEESLIQGFDSGADDFIRKPFNNTELLTRIRYQLSQPQAQEKVLRLKDITLSLTKHELRSQNLTLSLNRREFQILKAFFEAPGAILTRDMLLDKMTPSQEISDRTVDTHISHLRSKLKKENFKNLSINSVYGSGYKMECSDD